MVWVSLVCGWMVFYRDHVGFVVEQFLPVALAYGRSVAALVFDEVGEGVAADSVDRFIERYVRAYAARHNTRSRNEIEDVLSRAMGDQLLVLLRDLMERWRVGRVGEAAANELSREQNAVAHMVYLTVGRTLVRWVTVGRNCAYCSALGGRVVGIREAFLNSGESFKPDGAERPLRVSTKVLHPPAHKGCNCLIVAG